MIQFPHTRKFFPELHSDEQIHVSIRRHWASFLGDLILIVALILIPFLILIIFGFTLPAISNVSFRGFIILATSIYYLFITLYSFIRWIDYYFDLLLVTDQRVILILQQGIFSRQMSELPLNQVQNVRGVVSGILQTIYKYGKVDVESASAQEHFEISGIPYPYQIANQIMDLVHQDNISDHQGPVKETQERKKLGEVLLEKKLITSDQLDNTLMHQKDSHLRLGSLLVDKGYVDEDDLLDVLAEYYNVPPIDLRDFVLDPDVAKIIPENIVRRYIVIPVSKTKSRLTLAMTDPTDINVIRELETILGLTVTPVVSTEISIKRTINEYFGEKPWI